MTSFTTAAMQDSGAIGVEPVPAIYLIFWGPIWTNGFTTTDRQRSEYTSQQLQSYVTSFLKQSRRYVLGRHSDEYCDNVPVGRPAVPRCGGGNFVTIHASNSRVYGPIRRPCRATIVTLGLAENLPMIARCGGHRAPQCTSDITRTRRTSS